MPKNQKEEMIYTTIGVILMAFIMTAFNKFRVMHEFSSTFWWETFKGFWLRFIVAWPSQYFLIQPIAAKKTAEAERPRICRACGAPGQGRVCAYCGTPYDPPD